MHFDVIIVGGGLYGSISAYFLVKMDYKVLLIEKDTIASTGATSYSQGIVRVYDPDEELVHMSYEGVMEFLNWDKNNYPEETPYKKSGFLYLAKNEQEKKISRFVSKYNNKDYPIEVYKDIEISKKFPFIRDTKDKIGIFEINGGYGNPRKTALNFFNGFKKLGGTAYENCKINRDMIKKKDEGWAINLNDTIINTKTILFTTGAYINDFFSLPVYTRTITLTQFFNKTTLPIDISIVDEEIETFIRPIDSKSFHSGSQIFENHLSPREINKKNDIERFDSIQRVNKLIIQPTNQFNFYKGFDSYTENKQPLVGFIKEGIYVATGFSGRGYKYSIPKSKKIVAEISNYLKSK